MSVYKTAWTKSSSSLTSDRLRPITPTKAQGKGAKLGKDSKQSVSRKSKIVSHLETIHDGLKKPESHKWKKDPKGGCFCQAREHKPSTYIPICYTCALILCELNLPHHLCPHCLNPLVTNTTRETMVSKLEAQIAQQLAIEDAERLKKDQEEQRRVGAFPSLPRGPGATGVGVGGHGSAAGRMPKSQPQLPSYQGHKVISLNAKTKKVVVSSYSTTPASSRPSSRSAAEDDEDSDEGIARVPAPPTGIAYVKDRTLDTENPWVDLAKVGSGEEVVYVAPLVVEVRSAGEVKKGRRRKKKGDGKNAQEAEGGGQAGTPTEDGKES